MAYPILGTPKPAFFDSSGSPLVSGTLTITDPDTSQAKAWYPTAADADAGTNGSTTAVTLDSRGEPTTQLWGLDGQDYTVVLKDSDAATIYTLTNIRLPVGAATTMKVKGSTSTLTNTTLANDAHLAGFTLTANNWYKLTAYFVVTADAASRDFKYDFVFDQTPQTETSLFIANDATTANTIDQSLQQSLQTATTIDIDGTANVGIYIVGFIYTHATATTTLDLQVAQGTDAGTTSFLRGSWIKVEPLSV